MKVLVLNGSPKGKYSITLQTLLYLEKAFRSMNFSIFMLANPSDPLKRILLQRQRQ